MVKPKIIQSINTESIKTSFLMIDGDTLYSIDKYGNNKTSNALINGNKFTP